MGRRATTIAVTVALLTVGLATVPPSLAVDEPAELLSTEDAASPETHCDGPDDVHVRNVESPILAGESADVYLWTFSNGTDTYYYTAYLKGPDGDWLGEFFADWHFACSGHYHYPTTPTIEQAGVYEVWAFASSQTFPTPQNYEMSSMRTFEVLEPTFDVTRQAPTDLEVGQTFRGQLEIAYETRIALEDFTFTENLGEGLDHVQGGDAWTDDTVSWNLGDIEPGDTFAFTYEAEATEAGVWQLQTSGSQADGSSWGPFDPGHDVTVSSPDIRADRSIAETVASGELQTVEVTYENAGTADAHDVTLADTFDSAYTPVPEEVDATADIPRADEGTIAPQDPDAEAGFTYGTPAADQSADPLTVKGEDETTFTWSLDELGVGETVTVTYTLASPVEAPYLTEDPIAVEEGGSTYTFSSSAEAYTSTGTELTFEGETAEQTVLPAQEAQIPIDAYEQCRLLLSDTVCQLVDH